MCMVISYHFLRVNQTKPGWTATCSGTDHTAPLRGDVEEEEVVALVVSSPSSPFSPEKACSQVPEQRPQRWSLRGGVVKTRHVQSLQICSTQQPKNLSTDLVVQRRVWWDVAQGIYMWRCLLHTAHLYPYKCKKHQHIFQITAPQYWPCLAVKTLPVHCNSSHPKKKKKIDCTYQQ